MKKYKRITDSEEFDQMIQKRRYRSSKSFTIYFKKKEKEHTRFGIAISKKLGNAVVRNKTKRQIRNMIREIDSELHKFDYIIMIRRGYFTKTFEENQKDLEKTLKTVKM